MTTIRIMIMIMMVMSQKLINSSRRGVFFIKKRQNIGF